MKLIHNIASFALAFCITSCTDDTHAFVQKIEATQLELKHQDSLLISYRSEISSMAYVVLSNDGPIKYTILNTGNAFIAKVNPLITRIELMIQKNKALAEQVKTNTGGAKEVEKEYTLQLDQLELMKCEINSIKNDYEQITTPAKVQLTDSTEVK